MCRREAILRQVGVIGFFTMLVAVHADASDTKKPCLGLAGSNDRPSENSAESQQLFLTDNQCEAATSRELRLPLLEFEQEGEDPMTLSVGAKGLGGILRFKIPFSF